MSDLNADTHFYDLNALAAMSLADLQALWESVPTEEQTYLARVFEREASRRQIVEDADEAAMARYFLTQYREIAFVPAAEVWLKVPPAVQADYQTSLTADSDTDDPADGTEAASTGMFAGLPRWLLLAVPMVCMFVFAGVSLLTGDDEGPEGVVLLLPMLAGRVCHNDDVGVRMECVSARYGDTSIEPR